MKRVPAGLRGGLLAEPLIFEIGASGRYAPMVCEEEAAGDGEPFPLEEHLLRQGVEGLAEVSEPEVIRHFTRLSELNFSVSKNFYPLGSCTMKYNPVVNERLARLRGFSELHPFMHPSFCQGALRLMWELERDLAEIGGMDAVSLQPAAGAHGELAGMKIIRAYHRDRGDGRRKVLIPATAHGTNPASSALCGYEVAEIPCGDAGIIEVSQLEGRLTEEVAALMVTNPNTLGLFEREICQVAEKLHRRGALIYMDGANLNALMGVAKPGDMGADVVHFNLHKTFSRPHGGGGPGAGPVGVKKELAQYLPVPRLIERDGKICWSEDFPKSIGRVRSFYGNFGVMVKAYCYIRTLGGEGLAETSRMAVLNSAYLRKRLEGVLHLPYRAPSLHESVFDDEELRHLGVSTLDIAKRLLDYGFHAPTIYFPLVVRGAIMVEPTETESKQTLDAFADAVAAVVEEAKADPGLVKAAPHATVVGRLDETRAARRPVLRWRAGEANRDR